MSRPEIISARYEMHGKIAEREGTWNDIKTMLSTAYMEEEGWPLRRRRRIRRWVRQRGEHLHQAHAPGLDPRLGEVESRCEQMQSGNCGSPV